MLKVGLVGVGGMGSVHLKNWRAMEGVQLTAICDIRHDLLKEKADGEKLYTDFDEMLENESFDIIDVCTPSYLHKEHSIKALKRGIHVLTEKPAALHPEDVKEMYRTAEEHHVKLMVAHVIRFMKDYQILKEICRTKKYGELLEGHFWRLSATPTWSWDNWMQDEQRSGLVPFDLHIHDCDFIYSLLGRPHTVSAVRSQVHSSPLTDHYIAKYDYPNATVYAEASWYAGEKYPFRVGYEVIFEKAVLRLDESGLKAYQADGALLDYSSAAAAEDTGINLTTTDGYFEEMLYFKNCVENDTQPAAVPFEEVEGVISVITEGVNNAKINHN